MTILAKYIFSFLFSINISAGANSGCLVTKVVDGDTFHCKYQDTLIIVRLLGVDTPELHHPKKSIQCFANEAKVFTESQILGKKVKLSFEGPMQDRYERFLAWTTYGNKKNLSFELVKNGYGVVYTKYPTSKMPYMLQLERKAKAELKGIWGSCR